MDPLDINDPNYGFYPGQDLSGANFNGTDFSNDPSNNLSFANLTNALMENCNFSGFDLTNADLTNANLSGTNLSSATLTGVISSGIIGTPINLPAEWILANGYLYFIGPAANLTNADLSGTDLSGVDLTSSNLASANLTNVNLTSANLTNVDISGTNFSGATLTGVISSGIIGTPINLPAGWILANGYLVGQGVNLTGVDLSGTDLTTVNFVGVRAINIIGTPVLPGGYTLSNTIHSGQILIGPYVRLTNINLSESVFTSNNINQIDFTGSDFSGATIYYNNLYVCNFTNVNFTNANVSRTGFFHANLTNTNFTNANLNRMSAYNITINNGNMPILPPEYYIIQTTNLKYALVGPYVVLTDYGFTNLDMAGLNLTGVEAIHTLFNDTDLSGTDLSGTDLSGANLTGTNLTGANLTGTNLIGANLTGANLIGANLTGANLTGANITRVDFTETNVSNAIFTNIIGRPNSLPTSWIFVNGYLIGPAVNLTNADLSGLDLSGVDLTGANLTNTILSGTNFSGTTLTGVISSNISGTPINLPTGWFLVNKHLYFIGPTANLSGADLSGVDLSGVDLTGANLTTANLTNTILSGTNFSGTTLTGVISSNITGTPINLPAGWIFANGYLIGPGVNLTGLDLSGVDLSGFDLTGANLTNTNLSGTNFSGTTLTGVISSNITGIPINLPTEWFLVNKHLYFIGPTANLSGVDLSGVDLSGVDLSGVDLTGANLTTANLTNTILSGTNFSGTTLTGVISSNITGTPINLPAGWIFANGYLIGPGVNLTNADLSGVDLYGLDLTGANFTNVNLTNVDLTSVNLNGIRAIYIIGTPLLPGGYIFVNTNYSGQILIGTNVRLTNVDLRGVDFSNIFYDQINFAGSDLSGAIFINTLLISANLTDTNFTSVVFNNATIYQIYINNGGNMPILSPDYHIVQTANIGYALVGPYVGVANYDFTDLSMSGFNLTGVTAINAVLNGTDLSGTDLSGANLANANLTNTILSGTNFSNANLNGVISSGISGTPINLPTGWFLVNGYLIGPGSNLTNVDLSGTDLSGAILSYANLSNANLTNVNLTGANMKNAILNYFIISSGIIYDDFTVSHLPQQCTIIGSSGSASLSVNILNIDQYTTDNLIVWPIQIFPTSTFSITIVENIIFNSPTQYFIINGTNTVVADGFSNTINISGVSNYPGIFQSVSTNLTVQNLGVLNNQPSTLLPSSGWIIQHSSMSNVYNCYSNGDISESCGGIYGSNCTGVVANCYSTGNITGQYAGGIFGESSNGIATNCYSTGIIDASDAGGIFGAFSTGTATKCYSSNDIIGNNAGGIFGTTDGTNMIDDGQAIANYCYSVGNIIGENAGGIFGYQTDTLVNHQTNVANTCYSNGNVVGNNAGGIFGALINSTNVTATNCYSSGSLVNEFNGIWGTILDSRTIADPSYCYVANNAWNDSSANSILKGTAGSPGIIGTSWTSILSETPFKLSEFNFAYSLSSNTIYYGTPYSTSLAIPTIANLNDYAIIDTIGSAIAVVDESNGMISFTNTAVPGKTIVNLYAVNTSNNGYGFSQFTLNITSSLQDVWYSIGIIMNSSRSVIFNGRFRVNIQTGLIVAFYNDIDLNQNILAHTTYDYGANYIFNNNFTDYGTTIFSIPALDAQYDAVEWSLYQYPGFGLSYKLSPDVHPPYTWIDLPGNTVTCTLASLEQPPVPVPYCFKEDTKISVFLDNREMMIPIQMIRKGMLVKTLLSDYVPVYAIGTSTIYNSGDNLRNKERLYKCSKNQYPELTEDLILTGCHSILVDSLSERQKSKTLNLFGNIYVTDNKYRLFAFLDEKSEPYQDAGNFNIYHLALEHSDQYMNYGIYANGLLVESASKRSIEKLSGMKLID